jgi:isoleucyl-tRNA synthetase
LPLNSLTVAGPGTDRLAPFRALIEDEVNVRTVSLEADAERFASSRLTVNFKLAAPRLGPAIQAVAAAAKKGNWELMDGEQARVGDSVLLPGEFEMLVTPVNEATTRALGGDALVVVVDTVVTEDLAVEGRSRDLVREVQQMRRDAGFQVTDRIVLEVSDGPDAKAAWNAHHDWIAEQVLAVRMLWAEENHGEGWRAVELADGTAVSIRIARYDGD